MDAKIGEVIKALAAYTKRGEGDKEIIGALVEHNRRLVKGGEKWRRPTTTAG